MARRALLLRLLLSLTLLHGAAAIKCYFHDESIDNSPGINPAVNGTTNMCCDSGESFLPNGLCLNNADQTITRRSCTDKNWGASGCQDLCADHFDTQRSRPWVVTPCDGTPTSLTWCCRQKDDLNGACCQGGSAFARYTIAAKLGDPIPDQNVLTTNQGLSTGAKVGIAVGAVVGAVFLVGVVIFAIRFRRWKKRVETSIENDIAARYASPPSTGYGSPRDMKPVQLDVMENWVHEAPVIYRHAGSPEPQELEGSSLPPTSPKLDTPTTPSSTTPLTRPSSIQQTPLMMMRIPQRTNP